MTSPRLLIGAAALLLSPALVMAQAAPPAGAAATTGARPAAKAATPTSGAAAKPASKRAVRRSALKAVEAVTPIDEDKVKLTDTELELSKQVYVGVIPCELGASVTITPNEKRPGFFVVQTKAARFHMHTVEARTGAIRLEDPRAGALWIQLGNKSMLMSQKHGQRLADECMSPAQLTLADELKKNPMPGLLDAPKPALAAASAPEATALPAAATPASAASAASAAR